ncbi:hypothetical protein [Sediminibacillus albus]|uniref:Uncharacterized protein n=1 Tax=Sediminibacillus albus TaxID=407036 RepID=A0A1G8WLZ6_9BACI|nr:hypothetical protein [Sediminibacillus albus]SDJ79324.1 hypothetical protein SAMN05216243_0884 [Sediminibacillus albus]
MNNSLFNKGTFLLFLVVLLVGLAGCGNSQENTQSEVIGNPTPEDFLEDGNADIFLLSGIVYSNVEHVDWVKELDYTIGEEVGEITKQTDKAEDFGNGTSNILPIGTKIYETDTQIYIAIVNDKEIPYLKMLEG